MCVIRVAIADDHAVICRGVAMLVNSFKGMRVVIEAHEGKNLINLLNIIEVDVIIMDIKMPGMDGIATTKEITKKWPAIKVLAFSILDQHDIVIQMVKNGAFGYLPKTVDVNELEDAINVVSKGRMYSSELLVRSMSSNIQEKANIENNSSINVIFTKRETEVLHLICSELSGTQIAKKLFLSPRTVEKYRASLFRKTKTCSTAGLALYAIRNGIIK